MGWESRGGGVRGSGSHRVGESRDGEVTGWGSQGVEIMGWELGGGGVRGWGKRGEGEASYPG